MNFLKVLKQVETIIKGEKYVKGTKSDMQKNWEGKITGRNTE